MRFYVWWVRQIEVSESAARVIGANAKSAREGVRGGGYGCVCCESFVLSGRADHSSRGVPNMVCGHKASIVKIP